MAFYMFDIIWSFYIHDSEWERQRCGSNLDSRHAVWEMMMSGAASGGC